MSKSIKPTKHKEWTVLLSFLNFGCAQPKAQTDDFGRVMYEARRRDFSCKGGPYFLNEEIHAEARFIAHFRPKSNHYEEKLLTVVITPVAALRFLTARSTPTTSRRRSGSTSRTMSLTATR